MRITVPLVLSLLIIGVAAPPVQARDDDKKDEIGELLDFKKKLATIFIIKNLTGLCVEAQLNGSGGTYLKEYLEPGEQATFTVESGGTYQIGASTCESSLCDGVSESYQVTSGSTTELCVMQSPVSTFSSLCSLYLLFDADVPASASPEVALSHREVVVLSCSTSGLFVLACLGYLFGRTPRRREQTPQQE